MDNQIIEKVWRRNGKDFKVRFLYKKGNWWIFLEDVCSPQRLKMNKIVQRLEWKQKNRNRKATQYLKGNLNKCSVPLTKVHYYSSVELEKEKGVFHWLVCEGIACQIVFGFLKKAKPKYKPLDFQEWIMETLAELNNQSGLEKEK